MEKNKSASLDIGLEKVTKSGATEKASQVKNTEALALHTALPALSKPSADTHAIDSHNHSEHSHGLHSHQLVGDENGVGWKLKLGMALTLLFVLIEFGAGWWSHSLALISDAGHNLTDVLALGFSLWALNLARRAPNYNKTYGYHRAGILAAVFNATTLVVIALYIFYEAVGRLLQPEPVQGWTMAGVAAVALLINATIAFSLQHSAHSDLNVRSAFIHMLGDALSSVGVILAGIAIALTGWLALDPLVSILIGLFILWSSWGVMKEATNILLEASPQNLDMDNLMADMRGQPNVRAVHDLHVWTIGSGFQVLSCHIMTNNCTMDEANTTVQSLNKMLESKYEIRHATLQLEYRGCQAKDTLCSMGQQNPCC